RYQLYCRHHPSTHSLFLLLLPPPPSSTLFPYTTLFRSLVSIGTETSAVFDRWLLDAAVSLADQVRSARGADANAVDLPEAARTIDRKSTRLNSSHLGISYAVFCLKKKKKQLR